MKHLKISIISFIAALVATNCANIVPPSGGDKDIEPPEVIYKKPMQFKTNFSDDKITILFNEYVQLDESKNKVFFSPSINPKPKLKINGKKLEITINKELLLRNTTYEINLNGVIKDNNEGNVKEDLNYVFSTGSYIDSLSLEGEVQSAYNNKNIEDISVALYRDSVLFNLVKTSESGRFKFNYLKPGKYDIIAFKDKNFNATLDSNEANGFLLQAIELLEPYTLEEPILLSEPQNEPRLISHVYSQNKPLLLVFDKSIREIYINRRKYADLDRLILNEAKDSLNYWFTNNYEGNDTVFWSFKGDESSVEINIKPYVDSTVTISLLDSVYSMEDGIVFTSNVPIKEINAENIHVLDSLENKVSFETNVINNEIRIIPNKVPHRIVWLDSAFQNMYGFTNSLDTMEVKVIEQSLLGSLTLQLDSAKPLNLIAEVYNSKGGFVSEARFEKETVSFYNLKAGTYKLRIYTDENNNGVWDAGNYFNKQQPEPIIIYNDNIEITSNWEYILEVE